MILYYKDLNRDIVLARCYRRGQKADLEDYIVIHSSLAEVSCRCSAYANLTLGIARGSTYDICDSGKLAKFISNGELQKLDDVIFE